MYLSLLPIKSLQNSTLKKNYRILNLNPSKCKHRCTPPSSHHDAGGCLRLNKVLLPLVYKLKLIVGRYLFGLELGSYHLASQASCETNNASLRFGFKANRNLVKFLISKSNYRCISPSFRLFWGLGLK